jgi:hypothetical protein
MTYPLHAGMAVAPLRAASEISLTDVVTFIGTQRVRQPNGEYLELPAPRDPVSGWLGALGAKEAQIAAAAGIEAQWTLHLPIGTAVRPGMTARVERQTDDEDWTKTIKVTGVDLPNGVHLTCTAVDVALNQ